MNNFSIALFPVNNELNALEVILYIISDSTNKRVRAFGDQRASAAADGDWWIYIYENACVSVCLKNVLCKNNKNPWQFLQFWGRCHRNGDVPQGPWPSTWNLPSPYLGHPGKRDVIRWIRWIIIVSCCVLCAPNNLTLLEGPCPHSQQHGHHQEIRSISSASTSNV